MLFCHRFDLLEEECATSSNVAVALSHLDHFVINVQPYTTYLYNSSVVTQQDQYNTFKYTFSTTWGDVLMR